MKIALAAVLLTGTVVFGVSAFSEENAAFYNYEKKCALCHGHQGEGVAALAKMKKVELSDLALNDKATLDKKDSQLFDDIKNGIGKSMPAYKDKLSDDDITALVAYMRTFAVTTSSSTLEGTPDKPAPASK